MPVMELQRPDSRRDQILEQAALLFGEYGYDRTSIRGIAAAVGMLPGSVYYHFPSKEALLAAVYTAAIDRAIETLHAATAPYQDPWDRLEAASVAHLGILVGGGSISVAIADGPNLPATARAQLVKQRHRYEAVFRDLVAEIDLPPDVTPSSFRLALLGAFNWALTWFRADGDPAETVARNLFAVFRAGRLPSR
jgi:TetR/AcrR family transcriptional regulator, cholesterol catabolism regulator